MLEGRTYNEIYENFRWDIPEKLNIGVEICDKWAQDKYRLALIHIDRDSQISKYSYWELKNLSNRFANALCDLGVTREDRVAVFLPNTPETLISHIAIYKTGAILVPLLTLFGPMAIEYRLQSSGARVLITDGENLPKVLEVRKGLPDLEVLIVVDGNKSRDEQADILDFWDTLENGNRNFDVIETGSDDPALIVGFNLNLFPQPGDLLWTHCDWAYVAGSFTALYPTLNNGLSVVNYERTGRFDPDEAFRVISEHGVTVIFAIASALRIMMENVEHPSKKYDLSELRSIAVGGETMGQDLLEWGREELGVELNENYGLTECDYSICNCSAVMEIREGSMGRAIPGHVVEIIDDSGNVLPPDTYGQIAIRKPNPSIFIGYWNDPEATRARFVGDWLCTGDYATKDVDGYYWFTGREDDIIESGGYRIGPGEIEAALKRHDSVADAAIIGIADAIKGEVVKAFVTVKSGVVPDQHLQDELRKHVRNKLEAHAYPKEIEFLDELPVGNTGKVMKQELRRMEREKAAQNSKGEII